MRSEDNVGDTYNPEQSIRCWSHYMHRCFESHSFELSETIKRTSDIEQKIIKLKDTIYSRCNPDNQSLPVASSSQQDSILTAYKSALKESGLFREAFVKLSREETGVLRWNIRDSVKKSATNHQSDKQPNNGHDTSEEYVAKYECVLRMHHYSESTGEAIPLDGQNQTVLIRGFNNRKGAFDGDTVEVGVFDDNPIEKCYGRVLRVIDRANNDVFLCQVSANNAICLCPVSGTDPVFINLPFLTRRILESRGKDSIFDSTESNVVVFDARSVENFHGLPRVKKVYPLSIAKNMVFLVKFIKWDLDNYRNPLGAVIEVFPKGFTLYNSERILRQQYNYINREYSSELLCSPPTKQPDHFCITIDPENAHLLDDAISLKQSPDDPSILELGIHIINVAKYVPKNSEFDKFARENGISVYPGCIGTLAPIDMLPPSFRESLSLIPAKRHCVFSLVLNVKIQGQNVTIVSDPELSETVVESVLQLTYEKVQEVMDTDIVLDSAKIFEEKNLISLKQALKSLYIISCHLKKIRLNNNDSRFAYDVSDHGEEKCWQAHMMIEEMMIFVNKCIAEKLCSYSPKNVLLRRQRCPNVTKKAKVVEDHQKVMHFSHKFTQLVNPSSPIASNFLVPTNLLQELVESWENKTVLVNMLSSVRLFPQLSVVNARLLTCYSGAEYCCTVEEAAQNEYRHDSLNLDMYTHSSSPLRRYMDIVTQQMLTVTLNPQESIDYSTEELTKLCRHLNKKTKNASKFEAQMSVVAVAVELKSSSKVYDGFVCGIEKGNTIEMVFPSLHLKHLMPRDRTLRLHHLGQVKSVDKHGLYSIDVQVASMSDKLGAVVLEHPSLVNVQSREEPDANSNVVCQLWTVSEYNTLTATSYQAGLQPNIIPMSTKKWKECMEFTKDPCDRQVATIKGYFQSTLQASTQQFAVANKGSTLQTCPISFLRLQFKIEPYRMFKIWLTWSGRGAFINSAIQLVELSPFVRVCVQHISHPAESFSDSILVHASRRNYPNIEKYVELWEKIVLAEASESSVKDSQMVILQDVVLNWPRLCIPSNCVDEKYYLPTGVVTFTYSAPFQEHCSEIFKIDVGDLVCVRYGIEGSTVRGVFHFVVCKIMEPTEINERQTVHLKVIGESNCRVSEQMKGILKNPCELQVITLSTSFQRVYSGLLNLLPPKQKEQHLTKASSRPRKQKAKPIRASSKLSVLVATGKITWRMPGSVLLNDVDKSLASEENAKYLWNRSRCRIPLNEGQVNAIKDSSKRAFHLIQGPPGTGKSETGAHLAYIYALLNKEDKSKCVMYCGPSNKAVDVVLEKFHNLRIPLIKILRIYGKTTERIDFPNPGELKGHGSSKHSGYSPPIWAKEYSLHHIIRKASSVLRDREEKFSKFLKGVIPCGTVLKEYRQLVASTEMAELMSNKYDIIFCTCNEAASSRVQKYLHPAQVIIDESGMATEPETIIPISICDHVTVIGDHKQLQPVIEYGPAREKGLSISLFQRYAEPESDDCCISFLDTQYRMHKEICNFPSQHFYEGKLVTDDSVKQRTNPESRLLDFWPGGADCPILFCNVIGKEIEEETSNREGRKIMAGSKCNIKDAKKTVQILGVLHFKHGVNQSQLAVLTPYASQEVCIRQLADSVGLKDVTVTTIIKSQGDEYGFVVLSTVRSQPIEEIQNPDHVQPDKQWLREKIGFVANEHQTNVAITRSKYGLIIVGNQMLLEYDLITWKPLIKHYRNKKCICNGEKFPSKRDITTLPEQVRRALL